MKVTLEKQIERHLAKWRPILGLEHWTFRVHFNTADRADDSACAGDSVAQWQYLTATIRFYLPVLKSMDADEVEALVVHELCHVMLAPMESACSDEKLDQRELAVELTARALLRAYSSSSAGR